MTRSLMRYVMSRNAKIMYVNRYIMCRSTHSYRRHGQVLDFV